MAELDTLPTEVDPEKLRQLALLRSIGPATPQPLTPIGAPSSSNPAGGLQPIGNPSPVKSLSSVAPEPLQTVPPKAGSSASTQAELQSLKDKDANPWGSPNNHPGVLGKIGHVAAKIGNIAGDIVNPGAMALIPGTDLNRKMQERGLETRLGQEQTREGAARNQESEIAARKAQEERGDRAQTLAEKKEAFEEGKPAKPGTPDEQAVASKMQEVNPETKKPYTAFEARIALAQGLEDTKPEKAGGEPKTVTMLEKPGGKPYEYQYDKDRTYTGSEGYDHWKKIGPAKENALEMGLVGSLQPLLDQQGNFLGTFNTKTGVRTAAGPAPAGVENATTSSGARLKNTEANQFNTQYVKPSTDIEQNYRKFQNAYHDYQNNPATGAASMVALAQHLGSTFGSVKGTQMGENMIHEHKDAIGLFDRIGRFADQVASGQQLSAAQWKDFNDLIANTRQIQWETAARESVRRNQPVNFLPGDVQINLQDSAGKVRHVPGNRVQEYLDKGAKLAE